MPLLSHAHSLLCVFIHHVWCPCEAAAYASAAEGYRGLGLADHVGLTLFVWQKLLEEELTKRKSRVTHLELNTNTLSDEIVKANEIIRKLQQDSKNVHTKVGADVIFVLYDVVYEMCTWYMEVFRN